MKALPGGARAGRRAVLSLPFLALGQPALASRTRVGEVAAVSGTAVALFSGEAIRALSPAADVLMDDLLRTGEASRLACRLEGRIDVRLGENAALRVDALTVRGPRAGTAIRSFGGPMLFDRAPVPGHQPTEVVLPWARIGVRGTRFFAGVLDGVQAVFVARGQVNVATGHGQALLGEGEGVDISEAGAPGPVRRWGEARIARALALVD